MIVIIAARSVAVVYYVPPAPALRTLSRPQRRRACVVRLKVALEATAKGLDECQDAFQATQDQLQQLLERLDASIAQHTAQIPELHQTQQRLQSIIGIGPVVSHGLAPVLCRIPFRNADAFVAYLGLDPRPRDSGKKVGRRRLSKRGPGELRRLLYNAAMAATGNPAWHTIYQRYRTRGLSTTAALNIIARKIARMAWSLHRHQCNFDPERLQVSLT